MNKIRKIVDRYKKGFCDEDLWNIDYWFLSTLPKMLDEFAEKTIGYPSDFMEDGDDEKGMEEWKKTIREMSNHFKEANNPSKEVNEFAEELFNKYDSSLGDVNKKETKEEKELRDKWIKREGEIEEYKDEELRKGMKMFSQYFWDLWW
jgi:hypothetical protein